MNLLENSNGVYTNPDEKIKEILSTLYQTYPEKFDTNKKIRIKLSGDVKQMHLLNFSFALPDFKYGQAAKGNFSLGVFEIIKERYEELLSCFSELIPILKDIKEFQIDDKIFIIEFYLAGDLKLLATSMGINQANSTYACV
jgi:hypothetical protein